MHHHLALPQRSTAQASGAPELLTTPSPYLVPAVPSEPLSSLFEPLSGLRRKQKIRGLTSAPGLAQETGGPSGPAAFSVPHSWAQFRPSAQRVTGGQATRVGRGWGWAVPALVTSQCHMQIGRRHRLPGGGQPIRSPECSPGSRRRRLTKTRELGARGVSRGSRSPLGQSRSELTWGLGAVRRNQVALR